MSQAHTGAPTLIQRFGSASNAVPAFSCAVTSVRKCAAAKGHKGTEAEAWIQLGRTGRVAQVLMEVSAVLAAPIAWVISTLRQAHAIRVRI